MIICDLWPFTYSPAKRGIYGLLAICSLLPVVESLDGWTGRADSSGGGRPGLAVERLEAVTIGSSRCTDIGRAGFTPLLRCTLICPSRLKSENRNTPTVRNY